MRAVGWLRAGSGLSLCTSGYCWAEHAMWSVDINSKNWMRVARDSSYDIAIDTARVEHIARATYTVVYRTDHATPHTTNGKAFNVEIVRAYLHCTVRASHTTHRPTRFRALPARFRASLAVIVHFRVLFAFLRARVARIGARFTHARHECPATRHHAYRCSAGVGAITIVAYAR